MNIEGIERCKAKTTCTNCRKVMKKGDIRGYFYSHGDYGRGYTQSHKYHTCGDCAKKHVMDMYMRLIKG